MTSGTIHKSLSASVITDGDNIGNLDSHIDSSPKREFYKFLHNNKI